MAESFEQGGADVVLLDERYDAFDDGSVDELLDLLLDLVDSSSSPRVVLDFTHTNYISSRLIEAIFRAWKRIKERGGGLAICCVSGDCAYVLEVTRLDRIWTVCETREEAIDCV